MAHCPTVGSGKPETTGGPGVARTRVKIRDHGREGTVSSARFTFYAGCIRGTGCRWWQTLLRRTCSCGWLIALHALLEGLDPLSQSSHDFGDPLGSEDHDYDTENQKKFRRCWNTHVLPPLDTNRLPGTWSRPVMRSLPYYRGLPQSTDRGPLAVLKMGSVPHVETGSHSSAITPASENFCLMVPKSSSASLNTSTKSGSKCSPPSALINVTASLCEKALL
jgi:hypothetical protein